MLLGESTPASTTTFVEVAMIVFFAVFLLITCWVIFSRSSYFSRASRIPLDDHDVVTPRSSDAAEAGEHRDTSERNDG